MLEALLAGLFGLTLGSFLNVCIYRMPRDLSVAKPSRSFCPSCEQTIHWYDNIPLLSYVTLGGRCRNCKTSIPARYPMVEAATGVVFAGFVWWMGPTLEAVKYCAFGAIMVALTVMDLEERILADEFTLGGILLAFLLAPFVPMPAGFLHFLLPPYWSVRAISVAESVFAALFLSSVLYFIGAAYEKLRGREGLGFGDVKMVGMIGAFLGLAPALLAVATGSVLGVIFGLLYIFGAGKDASTYELPFGSFLGVGALAVAVWVKAHS